MPGVPRELAEHIIDVNKGPNPLSRSYEDSLQIEKQQSKKRSPSSWQQDSSEK